MVKLCAKNKVRNSLKIFKNFLIKDQKFQNSKNRPTERHNHAKNNKKGINKNL